MTIHFECPYCQKSLRAPEKSAGRTAKCTNCKKKLIVPEKKEVLVPGKDGKPIQVSKRRHKTKPKSKREKGKPRTKKGISSLDSEIEDRLKKEETEAGPRSEKEVNEFESELEKELEEDTKSSQEQ